MHPQENMPTHSDVVAREIMIASTAVHTDVPLATKKPATFSLIQLGLDWYSVATSEHNGENYGDELWPGSGGQSNGRKWPILFAGLMLGDLDMITLAGDKSVQFGEDGQIFEVNFVDLDNDGFWTENLENGVSEPINHPGPGFTDLNSNGVWDSGEPIDPGYGGYCEHHIGLAEFGSRHGDGGLDDDCEYWVKVPVGDPQPHAECDENDTPSQNYRLCCTASSWWGMALACQVMSAELDWNHDEFFEYLDIYRCKVYCEFTDSGLGMWVTRDLWALELWDQYHGVDCCNQYLPSCANDDCQ